jgi:TDG/mug DNA glycosylase family protein
MMAKQKGVSPKVFRGRLRAAIDWHQHNAPWEVEEGSDRHREMVAVMDRLLAGRVNARPITQRSQISTPLPEAPPVVAGDDMLPDLLRPGLKVVFCGTAPGAVSAARRAYYAGPGNRFWPTLFAVGLTPRLLKPEEFVLLPQFGIGLTDIAKTSSGADADIPDQAFDRGRLMASVRSARPDYLAFNGKKAASVFFGQPSAAISYGPAPSVADYPRVFVLPSTSGAAGGSWDPDPWHALAVRILG